MKTQEERKLAIVEKYNQRHENNPITKAMVEEILAITADDILNDIINTGKTKTCLGTVEIRYAKEKAGRNPKTSESITVPEHLKVGLKPSSKIRAAIEEIDIKPYREAAMAKSKENTATEE